MSTPTRPNLTPIELATLAATIGKITHKPEQIVSKALAIYNAACDALDPEKAKEDRWKGKECFFDYLKALVPRLSKNQLRAAAIEFRHQTKNSARKETIARRQAFGMETNSLDEASSKKRWIPISHSETEVAKWISGEEDWKKPRINWESDFVKFCTENDVLKIAAQRKRIKAGRAKGGKGATKSRERSRWLAIAKSGNASTSKEIEFLGTLHRTGESAGDALRKIGIDLDPDTIRECVRLLKLYDQKNN